MKTSISKIEMSAIIMAGGRGSRLGPLTMHRSKPSMFFGAKYRIIDFVMSNCVNSSIRKVMVVTQYKSSSLIRHLFNSWSFLNRGAGFLEVLPASQQHDESTWYRGTADSVSQNLRFIKAHKTPYTLILAGDHIYKMNYETMLEDHIKSKMPCTVGCVVVPREEGREFGIMAVNSDYKITDFIEKPDLPPAMPNEPQKSLASMGIYMFSTDYLIDLLEKDLIHDTSSHDFGKDIIPEIVKRGEAYAHPLFKSCVKSSDEAIDYWKDVGTVDSYWKANLELVDPLPAFDLYDKSWQIHTFQPFAQPAKFLYNDDNRRGYATDSIISSDCIISGGYAHKCILSHGVRLNSYSKIQQSIILPEVNIGRHCRIHKAIIDKGCSIPEGTVIGEDLEMDKKRFYVSSGGIVVVTREMLNTL